MPDVYDDIETRPWDDVLARHEELLAEQVSRLADDSAQYRQQFEAWDVDPTEIDSLDALERVPFTTKDDERRWQENPSPETPLGNHQAVPTESVQVVLSSSGTTGKPTYFGLTESDRESWQTLATRAAYAMGVRADDVIVHAIGRPIVPGGLPYIEGYAKLGATVVPAGGATTEQLLRTLADLRPDAFHTTPSHLEHLLDRADDVLDEPLSDLGLRFVIGGGEPGLGSPEYRAKIREGWGVDGVRDVMGLGDVSGAIAAECPEENGAHFIGQGHVHPELVDPETGEPEAMEAGAAGELVYTPLRRAATPLLRFRSGDYAEVLGTECACGRTSPRIRVIGRADDMLIYKAKNVYPEAIREVVAGTDGATDRMRVVLPHEDKVTFTAPIPIRVAAEPGTPRADSDIESDIVERVRNRLGVRVNPTVVGPDSITPSEYKTDLVDVREKHQ